MFERIFFLFGCEFKCRVYTYINLLWEKFLYTFKNIFLVRILYNRMHGSNRLVTVKEIDRFEQTRISIEA